MRERIVLLFIVSVGAYLRFNGLTDNPLWIDEATFAFFVKQGSNQEFITMWIGQLLGLSGESLRYISATAGTMTILGVYYAIKGPAGIYASAFVAVFPLFVFWDRMARPYAMAGFLVVVGWRHWLAYIPAILTTPIAVFGVRLIRGRLWMIPTFLVLAVLLFLIRDDSGRDFWHLSLIMQSTRWWYIPAIVTTLYIGDWAGKRI